jgi:FkbM family methyltransferase
VRRAVYAVLRRFPWVHRKLKKAYEVVRRPVSEAQLLDQFAREEASVQFLQIGAHDGQTDDHLHDLIRKHRWRGILFEPVAYLYERLVENYKGAEGLFFENRAISSTTGTRKFYRLRPTNDPVPAWYDQLGSFNKEVVLSHRNEIPNIDEYLLEEDVECVTIADALTAHGFKRVDVMLVDTEGADFEILKTVDLSRIRPKLIIYEHKHLSARDAQACAAMLKEHGYAVAAVSGNNTAAVIGSRARRYFGFFTL